MSSADRGMKTPVPFGIPVFTILLQLLFYLRWSQPDTIAASCTLRIQETKSEKRAERPQPRTLLSGVSNSERYGRRVPPETL
jgi:hypothetical protein